MVPEIGQGFMFRMKGDPALKYGLVIGVDDSHVSYVPVDKLYDNGVKVTCYDEVGAKYDTDRNNVRLRDCPPPFSDIGSYNTHFGKKMSNVYAIADVEHPCRIPSSIFDGKRIKLVDSGQKVSERDMKDVMDHPWEIKQKELMLRQWSSENHIAYNKRNVSGSDTPTNAYVGSSNDEPQF